MLDVLTSPMRQLSVSDQHSGDDLLPHTRQSRIGRPPAQPAEITTFAVFSDTYGFSAFLDPSWHGACTIDRRADAQTTIQLNIFHHQTLRRTVMKIENLSKDLDTKSLTAVRGGDAGNSATNTIGQVMNLSVPVAVMSAGPANTSVDVSAKQNANICNDQYAGDSYLALFPYRF
jgi:hypothetical protein